MRWGESISDYHEVEILLQEFDYWNLIYYPHPLRYCFQKGLSVCLLVCCQLPNLVEKQDTSQWMSGRSRHADLLRGCFFCSGWCVMFDMLFWWTYHTWCTVMAILTSDDHISGNRHTVHLGLNRTCIFPSMPQLDIADHDVTSWALS